jgi:alpha-beta hydrolase superfamily lysophospholipase
MGQETILLTVHGTNDGEERPDAPRWWEAGSDFSQDICRGLVEGGAGEVRVVPVRWSGDNSEIARTKAARDLVRRAAELRKLDPGCLIHVLAHSHGGNVVTKALWFGLAGSLNTNSAVVCFGTPFFHRGRKLDVTAIQVSIWVLALLVPGSLLLILSLLAPFGWLIMLPVLGVLGYFVIRWRGVVADRRLAAKRGTPILCLCSTRDEAVRALSAEQLVRQRFVAPETLAASTWRLGRLTILLGLLAGFVALAVQAETKPSLLDLFGLFLWLVAAMPVAQLLLWLVVRQLLERARFFHFGAWVVDRMVSNIIVSSAYGDDHDQALSKPQRKPWGFHGELVELEDAELGGVTPEDAYALLKEIYDDVMGLDNDKAMNLPAIWSRVSGALYHNAYFRDEGVRRRVIGWLLHRRLDEAPSGSPAAEAAVAA